MAKKKEEVKEVTEEKKATKNTKKKETKQTKKKDTKNRKNTNKKTKNKKEKKENIFVKFWHYLKDVRSEMGKVRWPNKKEMILYSGATLGFIIIFALFFMLNDVVISAVKQLVR